jgi:hypothetical protein
MTPRADHLLGADRRRRRRHVFSPVTITRVFIENLALRRRIGIAAANLPTTKIWPDI